ncbi:MAG: Gfo/Idh/MocA family oxidoreductase [Gemmataceae bacterium]
MSHLSRRAFLQTSAAGALAVSAAHAKPLGAGERINVACIGTGGRCRHLMPSLARVPNVRITALCDVYEPNLGLAVKLTDGKCFTTPEYRRILERKDIHAVLIAAPDHWHVPMTADAMAAGKDVYVEKPLTHSLDEGRTILDAAAKHKRVVQVGTQQRSMPHIIRARQMVRDGALGTIHKVHLTWNRNSDRVRRGPQGVDPKKLDWKAFLGNAPKQEFDEYKFRNWRWFWDFGGGLFTDLMVHWIDVAHWLLDLDHPDRAVAAGDHYTSRGVWQTPDTVQTVLHYGDRFQAHFEGTFSNARNGAMIEFMGSEATLYIDRGRFELVPEARGKAKATDMILGKGPRGRDFYDTPDGELLHLTDWIDAIRASRQPSAPIAAGVSSASAAHLANQALRGSGAAAWPRK